MWKGRGKKPTLLLAVLGCLTSLSAVGETAQLHSRTARAGAGFSWSMMRDSAKITMSGPRICDFTLSMDHQTRDTNGCPPLREEQQHRALRSRRILGEENAEELFLDNKLEAPTMVLNIKFPYKTTWKTKISNINHHERPILEEKFKMHQHLNYKTQTHITHSKNNLSHLLWYVKNYGISKLPMDNVIFHNTINDRDGKARVFRRSVHSKPKYLNNKDIYGISPSIFDSNDSDETKTKVFRRSPLTVGLVSGIESPNPLLHVMHHESLVIHPTKSEGKLPIPVLHVVQPLAHVTSTTVISHDVPESVKFHEAHLDHSQNHGPNHLLEHPLAHVTSTTVISHDEPVLLPVVAISHAHSHVEHDSTKTTLTETVTHTHPEFGSTKTATITVTHNAPDTKGEALHGALLQELVPGLDHDPHKLSVVSVLIAPIETHIVKHAVVHPTPRHNAFKAHIGGYGVGIDFGGHGSGHGFFI